MGKKLRADIILSLGIACRPAEQLRINKLRFLSSPLDWMMSYSLETAAHLFKTKFETFFQYKSIIPDNLYFYHVKDITNNIHSIHHFPLDKDIEDFYETTFRQKMLCRFSFINKFINNSRHVIFIFNRQEEIQNITSALKQFGEIYPKCKITFINIRSGAKPGVHEIHKVKVSSRLNLEDHYVNDTHKDGDHTTGNVMWWIGNEEIWHEILSTIKLSYRSKFLIYFFKLKKKYKKILELD